MNDHSFSGDQLYEIEFRVFMPFTTNFFRFTPFGIIYSNFSTSNLDSFATRLVSTLDDIYSGVTLSTYLVKTGLKAVLNLLTLISRIKLVISR